jgi:hypothetical protein
VTSLEFRRRRCLIVLHLVKGKLHEADSSVRKFPSRRRPGQLVFGCLGMQLLIWQWKGLNRNSPSRTAYNGAFDGFPSISPDGKWLASLRPEVLTPDHIQWEYSFRIFPASVLDLRGRIGIECNVETIQARARVPLIMQVEGARDHKQTIGDLPV